MSDAAIVETLLDTDFYKLTMCRFAHDLSRKEGQPTTVRYALRCRTKDARLGEIVDPSELREQLEAVRALRFYGDEIAYLGGLEGAPFDHEFLSWLRTFALPEISVEVEDGELRVETEGPWPLAILWETPAMAVVNELYARATARARSLKAADLWSEGDRRLDAKIAEIKASSARIAEFGTRRRFCRDWQEHVVNVLTARVPNGIVGTSNVALAKRYGLPPVGTMAHELFMVAAAKAGDDDATLRASQARVLDDWRALWGDRLSIALTDTYGTEAFFSDFAGERAAAWKGLRHDSGDAAAFGERAIAFYLEQGIEPSTKTIVFSDGLDVEAVVRLQRRFAGRVGLSFGWGTDLTFDVGIAPISLVMKAVLVDGHPTVKLSDNPEKASGRREHVERYKRVFAHADGPRVQCRT